MKRLVMLILATIIAASLLTACGGSNSKLIGKWERIDGSIGEDVIKMEIKKDGSWFIGNSSWNWTASDEKIFGTGKSGNSTQSYYYTISGSELTLTNAYSGDGRTAVFKKVK